MQLSEQGHSIVIIDKNREAFRRLTAFDGRALVGSGFDREILAKAEIQNADALASVTRGDNTNILCARIARDNFGVKNVVARIYDSQRASIYLKLGIPTVASALWTTQQVRRYIMPDENAVSWTDVSGGLQLVERLVPDALAGKPLSTMALGDNVRPVSLLRGGVARVAIDGLFAQEGDVVQFMVTGEGLKSLTSLLNGGES
jgi:trk system potassium uptake protein TrkA